MSSPNYHQVLLVRTYHHLVTALFRHLTSLHRNPITISRAVRQNTWNTLFHLICCAEDLYQIWRVEELHSLTALSAVLAKINAGPVRLGGDADGAEDVGFWGTVGHRAWAEELAKLITVGEGWVVKLVSAGVRG
ncbi:hypothetical protein L873DRAFT_1805249 [Choiromyces venosus 120613-1]|uniref:Uncharacterized protein n=1 Tax=Choiromyces venosus 120613-1 TaxID=1336337 RepID=A0A3N4JQ17_9PEZI|nr:hypothetical protein L873DRAFT_1805249 [Choiromyces venosus 120613-1]